MKIALCIEYPIAQAGGVSVLVLTLIREFVTDFEIVLVSPDDDASLAEAKLGSIIQNHVRWSPTHISAESACALADQIARAGVALAHFHFGGNFGWNNRRPARCPIPALAKHGVPIVTTIHMAVGLLHGYCGPQRPLLIKLGLLPFAWLNKQRVLRHVRREITVSRWDYNRLRSWYWPMRNKFTCIYHSRIQDPGELLSPTPREPVILGVGHIASRKGQVVLAEAFAKIAGRHPGWKLQFAGHVGDENCRQQVAQIAARIAPGQIELLGQRDDTSALQRRATIYVQPSFHEGLPLSLQEALWQGCACVATSIPGNIELVEHGRNGLLVPPGNPDAMAETLSRLITDPALRGRLAACGRAGVLAKGMTAGQMIQHHRALYAGILAAS